MSTVNPLNIERLKKYGRCGEIIYGMDDNMAKRHHSTAPQTDTVEPMSILQPDGTVKHFIHIAGADGSSRYVPEDGTDVYVRWQSKLKTIIELFPSGSICKIHLDDIGTIQAVIHEINFSTLHLEPALCIEFFKLEDIIASPAEPSPIMQTCVIYIPEQIESIDSSDAAEMSRELIKNEMIAIKKRLSALKDNLRQLSRLRNSRDLTSRLVSEIDRKYHALVQSLK